MRPDQATLDVALARARARPWYVTTKETLHHWRWKLRQVGLGTLPELGLERLERRNLRRTLGWARGESDVCWTHDPADREPLVTVRIATYNRGPLVAERAIASALAQTYTNIEVLVVGDACDEATAAAVEAVDDPRVRFVNLPSRGVYPPRQVARWMVAGAHPMNTALALAKGDWIAPCDDDDELTPDHVERLLAHALDNRLELVWSRAAILRHDGSWRVTSGPRLAMGFISHGSVIYSSGLRFMRHSDTCWRIPDPADWNLWRRMSAIGVRMGFLDELTYLHY